VKGFLCTSLTSFTSLNFPCTYFVQCSSIHTRQQEKKHVSSMQ
jgi:hypothetical protein